MKRNEEERKKLKKKGERKRKEQFSKIVAFRKVGESSSSPLCARGVF